MTTKTRILIADDDPIILRQLREDLGQEGYSTFVAESCDEALEIARRESPDLILADWLLPGGGGPAYCALLKEEPELRAVHVLLMTTCGRRDNLMVGLDAGANDYITKPLSREDLLLRIQLAEEVVRRKAASETQEPIAPEEMLGIIGHDLKTPLSSIRATSEFLITDECRESGDVDLFIRNIHDGIIQLSDMVDDLLESARLNSSAAAWNWGEIALSRMLDEALDAIRPLIDNAEVEIDARAEPADLSIRGDETAIRRLVVNLANNARKHTASGSIKILAHRTSGEHGEWVRIAISDTGTGFDPKVVEQAKSPFALNQGVVPRGGSASTGLGLFICRRIAEVHGGSITFFSSEGKGTTVEVVIRADLEGPASGRQSAA